MDSPVTFATIAIGAAIAIAVFLFIAKRVLRVAVRLMLVGLFIFALLGAAGWGWWKGWFSEPAAPRTARPAATPRKSPH